MVNNHTILIDTRYCESDALGHINSVSYFIYFEQARVKFLVDNNIVQNVNDSWPYILVSSKCDYKEQLFINESIKVNTIVRSLGRSSFVLEHFILREGKETILAIGESVMVYYDFNSQRSIPLTEELLGKFNNLKEPV